MHTMMILTAGLALLAIVCAVGWARRREAGLARAARIFIPVWFVAARVNVGVGVFVAGYTVMQELPVFAVTFAVPAAAGWLLSRRFDPTRGRARGWATHVHVDQFSEIAFNRSVLWQVRTCVTDLLTIVAAGLADRASR